MNADGCNSAGCTGSVVVSLGDGRFFDGEKTLTLADLSVNFAIKTTKVMAIVEMESLLSMPMPSFLEKPSKNKSADQTNLPKSLTK